MDVHVLHVFCLYINLNIFDFRLEWKLVVYIYKQLSSAGNLQKILLL